MPVYHIKNRVPAGPLIYFALLIFASNPDDRPELNRVIGLGLVAEGVASATGPGLLP